MPTCHLGHQYFTLKVVAPALHEAAESEPASLAHPGALTRSFLGGASCGVEVEVMADCFSDVFEPPVAPDRFW